MVELRTFNLTFIKPKIFLSSFFLFYFMAKLKEIDRKRNVNRFFFALKEMNIINFSLFKWPSSISWKYKYVCFFSLVLPRLLLPLELLHLSSLNLPPNKIRERKKEKSWYFLTEIYTQRYLLSLYTTRNEMSLISSSQKFYHQTMLM